MTDKDMREALELVTDALKKCITGRQIKAVEAARALKIAGESLAEKPATVLEGWELVAWEFQHEETGMTTFESPQQVEWGFEKNNPRWHKIGPLYRPVSAHKVDHQESHDLTDEERYDREWPLLKDIKLLRAVIRPTNPGEQSHD